jgi:hypothetical protein
MPISTTILAATFDEQVPADQTATEPSLEIPEAKKEQLPVYESML